MAILYTAKGTLADSTKSTSVYRLKLPDVRVPQGSACIVLVAQSAKGSLPAVKWGSHALEQVGSAPAGAGVELAVYRFYRRKETKAQPVLIDWRGLTVPTAKVATVATFSEVQGLGQSGSATHVASATPDSGAQLTSLYADEAWIAGFASAGPLGDDAGELGSFVSGQRVSTSASGDATDITLHEAYRLPAAILTTRALKTGATARDWAVALVTLQGTVKPWILQVTVTATIEVHREAVDLATAEADVEALDAAALNAVDSGWDRTLKTAPSVVMDSGLEDTDWVE